MSCDRRHFVRGAWLKSLAHVPTPDGKTEIASLVVHVRPERLDEVSQAIWALSGAEVAASDGCGKLVVTIEARPGDRLGEKLTELSVMPNIISATLVYHAISEQDFFDPGSSLT